MHLNKGKIQKLKPKKNLEMKKVDADQYFNLIKLRVDS